MQARHENILLTHNLQGGEWQQGEDGAGTIRINLRMDQEQAP